jgi:hypothetical protein
LIPETIFAYLAGYFDGEGSICILTGRGGYVHLRLAVLSYDRESIELFQSALGGSAKAVTKGKKMSRQPYAWYIRGREAAVAIRKILPYMIAKKSQVEVVLSVDWDTDGHKDPSVLAARNSMRLMLNKRRTKALPAIR